MSVFSIIKMCAELRTPDLLLVNPTSSEILSDHQRVRGSYQRSSKLFQTEKREREPDEDTSAYPVRDMSF